VAGPPRCEPRDILQRVVAVFRNGGKNCGGGGGGVALVAAVARANRIHIRAMN